MAETRRKFDDDFKEGAVRLARDLGINEGTLGNCVNADRRRRAAQLLMRASADGRVLIAGAHQADRSTSLPRPTQRLKSGPNP
jgi:transposase